MLVRLALDVATVRLGAERQMNDRERQQPKMIMMRPAPSGRARAAIADAMEIVDGLLDWRRDALLTSPFGKPGSIAWNVVSGPMTPNAAGRVRVVAEQSETLRS